ncbi:DFP-domain-containing protein [Hortaea werneckii]|nr:DFP-domain-containing protein [Hortaea werneckii]
MATEATNGHATGSKDNDYFATNPKPPTLERQSTTARTFINQHASANRKVALVTSGGTTVPLENQTVRFIDNFSAGTRGATSAEYFLENGYAVIFLHRQFSLLPYSRHYSHSTNCFLDFLTHDAAGAVVVDDEFQHQMAGVLDRYRKAKRENALLLLPFTTVNEYLWVLRELAMLMQPLGANGLFYLAAAVSDFFVPAERMVEHKIQSSEDFHPAQQPTNGSAAPDDGMKPPAAHMEGKSLIIDLDPVPKFLKQLVDAWAPQSMIISFKLETDPGLLARKARYALEKYSHHLVIGNLLTTRKWEVLFVSATGGERWIRVPAGRRTKSATGEELMDQEALQQSCEPAVEIEFLIVPEVAQMHREMIAKAGRPS